MRRCVLVVLAGCGSGSSAAAPPSDAAPPRPARVVDAAPPAALDPPVDAGARHPIRHVFEIVMENLDLSSLRAANAPYFHSLLASGAHADNYHAPHGLHPSEPNYIWLQAGSSLGIRDDRDPAVNHRATHDHLMRLLDEHGIAWKAYEETITGTTCPLVKARPYVPKHDPFVYFDDVTDGMRAESPTCIAHVRPLSELATDLASDTTVPGYAFITPNECHDMHDRCSHDKVAAADAWLRGTIGLIQASPAYASSAIFITWDESEKGDAPIGLIVVSPFAKPGYADRRYHDHSSTLKTVEEILGVGPLLGEAAAPETADLSDLFNAFP